MIYTTIKCGGKIDGYCTQQTIGSSSNYAAASVYHMMKASISRLLTTNHGLDRPLNCNDDIGGLGKVGQRSSIIDRYCHSRSSGLRHKE